MLQTKDVAKDIPGLTPTDQRQPPFNQIPARPLPRATCASRSPAPTSCLRQRCSKDQERPAHPDTETTFTLVTNRPPFVANEKGRALAAKAQAIYKEIDRELGLTPMVGGGTDAAYAARSGRAVVLESLGFGGWGAHAKDEYVAVETIVPRLYLVTRLLTEIGKQ
jgi:glutamate carboxypeptidase